MSDRAALTDEQVDAAIAVVWGEYAKTDAPRDPVALEHAIYRAAWESALAAERTRCAAIARAAGREDIAAEIEQCE